MNLEHSEAAEETKAEKFKRLGNYRMGKAIERIRQMHNLSAYEYTPEQVDLIIENFEDEIADLRAALSGTSTAIRTL